MCALRVIFLDVDGVLHPLGANHLPLGANMDDLSARIDEQQLEANEKSATYVTRTLRGVEFLDEHLAQLRRIVTATGAEIVLTTTWRQQGCDRRAVLRHLAAAGCLESQGEVSATVVLGTSSSRGAEIAQWLSSHGGGESRDASYVILDDDAESIVRGRHINCERFVHVDRVRALTATDADRAIALLLATAPPTMELRAAFDIGSGATKLGLARVLCADGSIDAVLHSSQAELLLRHDLQAVEAATGVANISDVAAAQLAATLGTFAAIARAAAERDGLPLRVRGVATAVFRAARNGTETLRAAAKAAGIEAGALRIITQRAEGALGYSTAVAVAPSSIDCADVVAWDSGGGSFQITDSFGHMWEGRLGSSTMLALMCIRAQGKEEVESANPATMVECVACGKLARVAMGAPPPWLLRAAARAPLVAIGGETCAFRMARLACDAGADSEQRASATRGGEPLSASRVWRAIESLVGRSDAELEQAGFTQAFMLLPKVILVAVVLETIDETRRGEGGGNEGDGGGGATRAIYSPTNGSTNGILADAVLWAE